MKLRYVGEGENSLLPVGELYIGSLFGGMSYEVPDKIGEYLIENYPYLFEKVEGEE